MLSALSPAVQLFGRIMLAAIFIGDGIGKIAGHDAAIASITQDGFPVPVVAYYVAVIATLGGGIAILVGWFTRPAALVLALFCIVTGVVVHMAVGDRPNMIQFYKNLCMAGGFLELYVLGAGTWSIDGLLSRKLD
jgi:putative oxidoreductase